MDDFLKVMMKEITKELENGNISKSKEQLMQKAIEDSAVGFKNLYDALVNVGFNEEQAFELVKVQLSTIRISR